MSEKEKETIEEEDTPVLTTLDKNEKDVETILDFLLSHGDPGQRGNALIRLEELGPDLSIDDLNFTTEILNKARKEEEVGKLIRKIDELLNEFWKYKKGLEFDGLEKPISLEVKKKVETTMIGALSSIEKHFGFLWGHESQEDLSPEEQHIKSIYDEVRSEILDKGNNQIRNLESEISQYEVKWLRYHMSLPIMSMESKEENDG